MGTDKTGPFLPLFQQPTPIPDVSFKEGCLNQDFSDVRPKKPLLLSKESWLFNIGTSHNGK